MPDRPTGTITFLFTDIEGSTRRWEKHATAMQGALARHDALLRQAIEAHGGYVFKTVGDAFCAAFATAPDALSAAAAAQRTVSTETWGEVGPLRVRMALHTGTAEERDGDYFGPPLNRVARLLESGHGGQTLLSLATQELARDALPPGVGLRDLGEHQLRDLARPEHVFQIVLVDFPAEFPPLRTLGSYPNNLPQQLTSFVGREREIAEIKRLLAAGRLLTLTGAGGAGKTRLSLQVAADGLEEYADGVWLVELAPLAEPALLPQAVASALGVRESPGRPLLELLVGYLQRKRLLLLLDNCEHLVGACAQLAETLLRACPALRILATSREALGIVGETAWRVPSLSLPDPQQRPTLEQLTQYEAVRLFIDRAGAAGPHFAVTNANAPAVAQICHRLDGIPLAIELAAARVKVLTVEQIAARLDDRFRLLTGGSRTALPRHQTLRALVDWSYELLTAPEQRLLQRLAVFAGGWRLEAADAVWTGDERERDEVLDLLTELANKSLVVVDEPGGEARYRLLETIRQYAGEKLREAGEVGEVRRRHRDWYVALAERAEPELWGSQQEVWGARLEEEHDNLRAALEWSKAEANGPEMQTGSEAELRLAGALWWFWHFRGYQTEGRGWLEGALSRSERAAPSLRAKALGGAGFIAWYQGEYTRATPLLKEALALSRELGDERGMAFALTSLGFVARFQGEHARAMPLLEEGLALSQELRDKPGVALALLGLAWVAQYQGDYARAMALFEEVLALSRELRDKRGMAVALTGLGRVAQFQGDHARAMPLLEEGLALSQELRDKRGVALALTVLGSVTGLQGDHARAMPLLEEALTLSQELGDKRSIALALTGLGSVAGLQGDYVRAVALHEEALTLCQQAGLKADVAPCLEALATVAGAHGQSDRAARLFGAAEALRGAFDTPLPPMDRVRYVRAVAHTRASLGGQAFTAAWAAGRAMSVDQAIAYGLRFDVLGC